VEINGSKGSLLWNLENMNELLFLDGDKPKGEQGFEKIIVTEKEHPFIEGYWPPGHSIGYEHTFINTLKEIVEYLAGKSKKFNPDFEDGMKCQEVLDAILLSSKERCWISISEFAK
jgi:predicted dehydrogenase